MFGVTCGTITIAPDLNIVLPSLHAKIGVMAVIISKDCQFES